jgi:hypothetical protein
MGVNDGAWRVRDAGFHRRSCRKYSLHYAIPVKSMATNMPSIGDDGDENTSALPKPWPASGNTLSYTGAIYGVGGC